MKDDTCIYLHIRLPGPAHVHGRSKRSKQKAAFARDLRVSIPVIATSNSKSKIFNGDSPIHLFF